MENEKENIHEIIKQKFPKDYRDLRSLGLGSHELYTGDPSNIELSNKKYWDTVPENEEGIPLEYPSSNPAVLPIIEDDYQERREKVQEVIAALYKTLSQREMETLALLQQGMDIGAIALRLKVKQPDVSRYKQRIQKKLLEVVHKMPDSRLKIGRDGELLF